MTRFYRASNKRMIARGTNGRFRQTTLADLGFSNGVNRPRVCECGHTWRPLLATGICPECQAQNSQPAPLTDEEKGKLAEYRAMPVSIHSGDHKTLNAKQALWEWLNARDVFKMERAH